MTGNLRIVSTIFIAIAILFSGCQKKITKVEPIPQPTPPPVVKEAPPPVPPSQEEFKPVDMDAQLKEVLQTVYFDFDKYDLKSDAISKLEKVASFLKDNPNVRVLAQGHTDERGSNEYNMALGENRAKAVKNYLTSYGISADRIETTSYGEERPARPNCGEDESCHAMNRRVEWQVLAK